MIRPADRDDRQWAAEKRDFVADSRDDAADSRDDTADERDVIADQRDAIADARDASADARELELDRREREADLRAHALRLPLEPRGGHVEREADRLARVAAGEARVEAREERAAAEARRESAHSMRRRAEERRSHDAGPTLLALAFAQIADRLYDADTYDEVLSRIAEAAVATVAGGELASVTLRGEDGYRSEGATGQQALDVDEEQYEVDEGPSLDAFSIPIVDAPSFPDARWPLLGTHPVEHGVESSLSYRLSPLAHSGDPTPIGSLNIYATTPGAFNAAAIEIGTILAAHASLAARAVGERTGLQDLGRHLEQALLSRDVIGQAKGIIMERLRTTPEDAFDILRRSSQRLNVKLRELALQVTETGEIPPETGSGSANQSRAAPGASTGPVSPAPHLAEGSDPALRVPDPLPDQGPEH